MDEHIQNIMVSEVQLIYRSSIPPSQRPFITRSEDLHRILRSHWDRDKIEFIEQFKVIYLNRGNRVLAITDLSTGGLTGTVADVRLIFAAALKLNATSAVLCHNHPSGYLQPSSHDIEITRKIKQAGDLLNIAIFDHIIIGVEGYLSFADEGLL
jgi:DNA repair protein RadC